MAVAYTKFESFVEALAEKLHNLGADQLKVALCPAASPPLVTNTVLANLTQASYTNCSTRNITTSTSVQTSGIYKLTLADLTLTASGGSIGPFRYVVIYNDTALNDELIAYFDYGSDITIADTGTFVIDFSASGGALTIQ